MPANPLRGEADLAVGEETYRLVFDVTAFVYAEEALGMTTDELVEDFITHIGNANLRLQSTMLWAGLQARHPCSHLDAQRILGQGVKAGKDAVYKALASAFGLTKKEDGESPNPPMPPADGTG